MDEVDLIGPCLDHLQRIGVSEIIVQDMKSTDGTRDILKAREGPNLRVVDSSNDESSDHYHQRVIEAVRSLHADRVVMIDADEFILPRCGNLPQALARIDADLIRLPRYNVVLGSAGLRWKFPLDPSNYAKIDLYAKASADFRERLQQDHTLAWLRVVPMQKVAVNPKVVERFDDGMHGIQPRQGAQVHECIAEDILIAHAALTDYYRFERKVANIREVFRLHDATLGPGWGWHWRRWVDLDNRGALRAEFERSHLSDQDIVNLRADGSIQNVADLLALDLG